MLQMLRFKYFPTRVFFVFLVCGTGSLINWYPTFREKPSGFTFKGRIVQDLNYTVVKAQKVASSNPLPIIIIPSDAI